MSLDFSILPSYWDLLLFGTWWTVIIAVASAALSLLAGTMLALTALYAPAFIRFPVALFAWLFMGTPLLLQLFLIYYGLPQIGITMHPIVSGILTLALHFAVYNSDVIRTAIRTIDNGQIEAARSLGFGRARTIFYIVLPQAFATALPQLGNNMIGLLKDTAIVSIIGISELINASQRAIAETYQPFEFYITAAAIYYLLNTVLEFGLNRAEKRIEAIR